MLAYSETNFLILLIEYCIVILKEIQSKNPEAHGWMGHDAQLDYDTRLDDIVFLWNEVWLVVDGEDEVGEFIHIVGRERPTSNYDILAASET